MKAYISAPYRGGSTTATRANVATARAYGELVRRMGYEAVIVHGWILEKYGSVSYPPGSPEDLEIIEYNLAELRNCDVMFICGPRVSVGMKEEIEFCQKHGIEIRGINDPECESLRV